ncbi:High cysteine membrane protein VSP-like [Giardia duodenalis]|uniref:High cysteine membrane protein VSP-like n=1 Tax=Giardia intestinalis (strain ATCC 50803 / WB clone C6) TaxID=184922 RepID=A8BHY9_GIAIC|nr:High cysteine membrane protein VSP-like [Giardia intestinalis]KAE8302612.1 High cysteine membrane protein VSP-like [Giardia intestinalis]|eukprot:XP_001706947.1 High cysteine membrane protein VSP-like [Giardia lamblia ATCC 50803]
MTLASLIVILTCFLAGSFSEETFVYYNGFGYSCEGKISQCLQDRCLVDLGAFFCTECSQDYVPINGTCVATTDEKVNKAGCVKSPKGGWCTGCKNGYFLFYGGCYELSGRWKASICDRAENGICQECGKGSTYYTPITFTNPNATSPERCIYCGDIVGFGGSSGVYRCQYCNQHRLPGNTIPSCSECSERFMCPFDFRCRSVKGLELGYCYFCPRGYVWSQFGCYTTDSVIGNSICLPRNTIDIQGQSLCTQCANSSEVPQNGLCGSISGFDNVCTKDSETGKCTSCKNDSNRQYFLFYGGCYLFSYAPGQVGSQICQTVQNNVCTACNSSINEVFTKNNGCWRCGDSANGGIEGCQRCEMKDSSLQCLECRDLYLSLDKRSCLASCPKGQKGIKGSSSSVHSCACDDGSYLKDGKCVGCAVENCAECDESSCKKCKYGYTLSGSQCVATKCKDPNCDTCEDRNVCTKCAGGNSLDPHGLCVKDCLGSAGYYKATVGGVSRCVACTLGNCAVCESESKCKTCRDGFYVEGSGGCKPCSSECATCSGPASGDCTSCPARKRLQYSDGAKGSCVPQCVQDSSCAECGLTVGGTSYCSRCAKSTEYPNNGACTFSSLRAAGIACANVAAGRCAACSSNSFSLNGGCYTSTLLPGKTVCTKESNGWCDSTVTGYGITYNGTLLTCPTNCAMCSSGVCNACNSGFYLEKGACKACSKGCATCPHGEVCFDCLAGYYFSESTCKACHKAISKCSLCVVPEGAATPVCLEYDSTSKKSALSSSAISGIAISVVLVVGGVAGVLVWFFVFRKKN